MKYFVCLVESIKDYYNNHDKPSIWFSLVVLSQLLAFLPQFPPLVVYSSFIGYCLYILKNHEYSFYIPLLLLIFYIPLELILVQPNEVFHSWERYAFFLLMLVCVSPLVINNQSIEYRKTIFFITLIICTFVGVGSFFSRIIGINYGVMSKSDLLMNVGTFGGLTSNSMILGPIAGIGCLFCCWMGFYQKKRIFWILAILSLFSVFFSASRSSLLASIGGLTILLYKYSDTKTTFIKILTTIIFLSTVSFPIWGGALEYVLEKNQRNIAEGSALSSRNTLWDARLIEFEESPVLGVGFDAVDMDLANDVGGFNIITGVVESGSSWLIILSMLGIIGAIILIPPLISSYIKIFKLKDKESSLVSGTLTLFYIHMIAEGYIFFGGSVLAFIMWLTFGVTRDKIYEHQ